MPIHIDSLTSDVDVVQDTLPLDSAQIDQLIQLVLDRIAEQKRSEQEHIDATSIRNHVQPSIGLGDNEICTW